MSFGAGTTRQIVDRWVMNRVQETIDTDFTALNNGWNSMLTPSKKLAAKGFQAFTLAEVVISIAVTGLVFTGILTGYVQSARRAEWSGYSLAAQALAIQQLEQGRSAVWDFSTGNTRNNSGTKTATGYSWGILDLPYSGTNVVRATNFVTVRMFYFNNVANPPVQLQMMQVDTVWPFTVGTVRKYFTNTVATYFAPDNRDPETL
jgi:type II secretory pathway pseudopilin PulG